MYYKKIIPPQHLQPYVECFYIWEVTALNSFLVESPPSAFGHHDPDGKIDSIEIEWNHADFQRQLGMI